MRRRAWYVKQARKGSLKEAERQQMKDMVVFFDANEKLRKATNEFNRTAKLLTEERQEVLYAELQTIERERNNLVVPNYTVDRRNILTSLSLHISSYWNTIREKCEKYVSEAFAEKAALKEVMLHNLEADMDYIFSVALELVRMYEGLGYGFEPSEPGKPVHSYSHLRKMFAEYQVKGIHYIIQHFHHRVYSAKLKRIFTPEELASNDEKHKKYINSPRYKKLMDDLVSKINKNRDA